jgi:cyclic-di-AMP phosphodiesterase PgpH
MGQKFYNQPQMIVGSKALVTVQSPRTDTIENIYETQVKRQAASNSSVPILMVDINVNESIDNKLQEILEQGNQIRTIAGFLADADSSIFSFVSQRYLRAASSQEWQAFQQAIFPNNLTIASIDSPRRSNLGSSSTKPIPEISCKNSICFEKLEHSALNNRDRNFQSLVAHISKPISGSHKTPSHNILVEGKTQIPNSIPADSFFSSSLGSNSDFFSQALIEIETYRFKTSKKNISALIKDISRSDFNVITHPQHPFGANDGYTIHYLECFGFAF